MADYADGIYMGNAEDKFFAQIFQIMDRHYRTSDLLKRYKAAVSQAENGIVQWESVSPNFTSYGSILDAAVSHLQSPEIHYTNQEFNTIITLIDNVIQQRERSLELGCTRKDGRVVIQNHEHVLSLWKNMKARLTGIDEQIARN